MRSSVRAWWRSESVAPVNHWISHLLPLVNNYWTSEPVSCIVWFVTWIPSSLCRCDRAQSWLINGVLGMRDNSLELSLDGVWNRKLALTRLNDRITPYCTHVHVTTAWWVEFEVSQISSFPVLLILVNLRFAWLKCSTTWKNSLLQASASRQPLVFEKGSLQDTSIGSTVSSLIMLS